MFVFVLVADGETIGEETIIGDDLEGAGRAGITPQIDQRDQSDNVSALTSNQKPEAM
jgi:hypothetical protein